MTTTLIAASAGTGKTYRICESITTRLLAGVDPARLLATTFTRKAARELADRVREHVIRAPGISIDRRDQILDRLDLAAIGTVHAVAHRLLTRFALPLGLSPRLEVLEESDQHGDSNPHLRRLLQEQLPPQWDDFEDVCGRLALEPMREALILLQRMRSNAMSIEMFAQQMTITITRWRQVIGTPDPSHSGFDQVRETAERVVAAITAVKDSTGVTQKTLQKIRSIARHGVSTWGDFGALSKLEAGKRSGADLCVEPLRTLGRSVRTAAGLHAHLTKFASLAPAVVAHLDRAYGDYKRARGLVDFNDLERHFLDLVRNPTMAPAIREELALFVVDEFQDTSPIQLAIFRALRELAGETIWVGDRKQAIYGFRGTDATLVDGVWRSLSSAVGTITERRTESRRSQGGVVAFTNALFSPSFGAADVTVTAHRPVVPRGVERWVIPDKKADGLAAIAGSVAALLRANSSPGGQPPSVIRPQDIAILLATNARTREQALALQHLGIPAVVPLPGLLSTREGAVVHAAVRVATDRWDSLASTELLHLLATSGANATPPWFLQRYNDVHVSTQSGPPYSDHLLLNRLGSIPTPRLAAPDLVRAVIATCDLPSHLAAWGSPANRSANLDALVALAVAYETAAIRDGKPSSPAGLIASWDTLAQGEEDYIPIPTGTDAVQLLTYHTAKGLEWPVVICGQLDYAPKPRLFEPTIHGGDPTAADPLTGRQLSYWVWPFGRNLYTGQPIEMAGLLAEALTSPEGQTSRHVAEAEMQRLLYVGCTRARDRLILATTSDNPWLNLLGNQVSAVVGLGVSATTIGVSVEAPTEPPIPVFHQLQQALGVATSLTVVTAWIQEPAATELMSSIPRWQSPSSVTSPVNARVLAMEPTGGGPIRITGNPDAAALGNALHTFLGGLPSLSPLPAPAKLARATEILEAWGISGCLDAALLVASGEALLQWIARKWPGSHIVTELPIEAPRPDGGWWRGTIDLVVLSNQGQPLAIIDHKAHGGASPSPSDALHYAPQLRAYRDAANATTELWVHHALGGKCAQLDIA